VAEHFPINLNEMKNTTIQDRHMNIIIMIITTTTNEK
jgi:hypothetical protein